MKVDIYEASIVFLLAFFTVAALPPWERMRRRLLGRAFGREDRDRAPRDA